MAGKLTEQEPFYPRQVSAFTTDADTVFPEVHYHAVYREDLRDFLAPTGADPAYYGFNPGNQLVWIEGFRQVVISTVIIISTPAYPHPTHIRLMLVMPGHAWPRAVMPASVTRSQNLRAGEGRHSPA